VTARTSDDAFAGEAAGLPIALLVSPADGRLRVLPPRRFRAGREWVERGQPVARVEHAGRSEDILAPMRGTLGGVLGRDGEPVKAGQPIAWMEGVQGEPS
jgi:acetyl/propionyl-CoA carboxylase alpha subunit